VNCLPFGFVAHVAGTTFAASIPIAIAVGHCALLVGRASDEIDADEEAAR